MDSRKRNRKVVFQRLGADVDDGTATVPGSFADYCVEWAEVTFGTGQERRAAAQEQASVAATFKVLRNSKTAALTVTDRISFDGSFWNIVSVVPSKEFNAGMDVTAIRSI